MSDTHSCARAHPTMPCSLQKPDASRSHGPFLLCGTGRTLVVSVLKHPLQPKRIRAELKSALKEVGPSCYASPFAALLG